MNSRRTSDDEGLGESDVPRGIEWDRQMTRDMGAQSADIVTLKEEVRALRKDVTEIKEMISMGKGSLRTLIAVGSIVGAIAAALGAVVAEVIRWAHGH